MVIIFLSLMTTYLLPFQDPKSLNIVRPCYYKYGWIKKKSGHFLSKELEKNFTHNDKTINTVNCTAYYKLLHSK